MGERLPIIGFAAAMAAIPFIPGMPPFWMVLLDNIGLSALVAMGLVLLTGVGGLTSFGQAAFCGFGAYTTAVLTTAYGLSPWLTLPLSLLVSGIAAVALGLVTVRLSGHYLPLGTIAWGLGLFYLFSKLEFLGRNDGISGIPPLSIGSLKMIDPGTIYFAIWIAVLVCALLTMNLLDSRTGRAIRALRRGHIAAEAFGIQTPHAKLLVFIYAAVLAGLSGWLYAHFQRAANPTPFGAQAGIEYLFIAVVGGAGYVWGSVLGAAIVVILKEILQSYLPLVFHGEGQLETIVFGILLVVLLQLAPAGIWPWLTAYVPFKPGQKRPDTSLAAPPRAGIAAGAGVLLQIDHPDRPQWRRQEHDLQPDHRRPHLVRRHDLGSWREARQRNPAAGGEARHFQNLPACQTGTRHDRSGKRRDRRASAWTGRRARQHVPPRPVG
jgi:ABC-type branched-subunit amino acid transport system permease subunit